MESIDRDANPLNLKESRFNTSCVGWDFSLYLVTDRTDFEEDQEYLNFLTHIERLIIGGVTILQLREKSLSDDEFLNLAKKVKGICSTYGVKFVINDNYRVGMEVGADGIHIGQGDTPLEKVIEETGGKIPIGVSVDQLDQLERAIFGGAAYIGIGPIFPTNTKALDKEVIGYSGVQRILSTKPNKFPAVAISGINLKNLVDVLENTLPQKGNPLDGVAVVSALMKSGQPEIDAKLMRDKIIAFKAKHPTFDQHNLVNEAINLIYDTQSKCPVVHHITNHVAINDCANITLAAGGSPIMAPSINEGEDIANISNALLINIGTLSPETNEVYVGIGIKHNKKNNPIILDPVGVGASEFRLQTTQTILRNLKIDLIKGNSGEITKLLGHESKARGVDAGARIDQPSKLCLELTTRLGCCVVMTGEVDYISHNGKVVEIRNGHPYLADITASGCMLGSVIATLAGNTSDPFLAGVAGVLLMTVAAQLASKQSQGPGTFKPLFMDQIHRLARHYPDSRHPIAQLANVFDIEA